MEVGCALNGAWRVLWNRNPHEFAPWANCQYEPQSSHDARDDYRWVGVNENGLVDLITAGMENGQLAKLLGPWKPKNV